MNIDRASKEFKLLCCAAKDHAAEFLTCGRNFHTDKQLTEAAANFGNLQLQSELAALRQMMSAGRTKFRDRDGGLTVDKLIEKLSAIPKQDSQVLIHATSFQFPGGFCSYRGYYEDLAIQPSSDYSKSIITVAELRNSLENVKSSTFSGWKGGEFQMDGNSRLWIAPAGTSTNALLVDVEYDNFTVWLITAPCHSHF